MMEIEHHHVSPNGLHPVHILGPARVDNHNPGDVVGYDEETVEKLLAMKQPDGSGQAVAERAVRVLMKKDAKHWKPNNNPLLKAGSMPALPPAYAKQLKADGLCEYVTKAHDEAEVARQRHADAEHYRKLAESMSLVQPAAASAKRA